MLTRLPNNSQRHVIVGATGSGKTQAAVWHLSHRDFDRMPWIIYNYKFDENIDNIPYARELSLDRIPIEPGIFITHPEPDDDDEDVSRQMKAIAAVGNIGVYVDEGYMIRRGDKNFRTLLTQGRSKGIPMIILSQRPLWMDRFVFSESEFYQAFRLQHEDDRKAASKIIPADFDEPLGEYYSFYYDAPRNHLRTLSPVTSMEEIHARFARRLGEMERLKRKVV